MSAGHVPWLVCPDVGVLSPGGYFIKAHTPSSAWGHLPQREGLAREKLGVTQKRGGSHLL